MDKRIIELSAIINIIINKSYISLSVSALEGLILFEYCLFFLFCLNDGE